jgi:hypothetical protein
MKVFDSILAPAALVFVLCASVISASAGTNVVVFDNGHEVPSNLMRLEKDPLKSASDPGYYGREFVFSDEPSITNRVYGLKFLKNGSVVLNVRRDHCVGIIVPNVAGLVKRFELVRNSADEAVLAAHFANGQRVTYTVGENEILEIDTSTSVKDVTFKFGLQHAIIPSFGADDLIYHPGEDTSTDRISIPAENILIGLNKGPEGENSEVVFTWPTKQGVRLKKQTAKDSAYFSELQIDSGGEPIFLAAMSAPGIWHREKLTAEFLEKDKTIEWKPPFMAKWQTQLVEGNEKTTYAFRHAKGTVWRGVAGSYNYPVWFEGDKANFSLSKKVPPKGEAVIYFLEGEDTPSEVLTPVDVLKETLGRPMAAKILDVEGRKLRTHHGDSGSNVHRACTCGYTEAIQAVFEKGEECDKKEFVDQSIQDMIYFVKMHLARIDEYRAFATKLSEYLQATAKSNPALKDYLEDLDATAQQIPAEYENQKENMKSLDYAAELEKKTMALTGKKDPENLKRYMELLKLWRGMGGAQDGVVAQYHILARKLFQDAGYGCVGLKDEKAVDVAKEIRARCKEILRNPDGYEIWANY